MQWRFASGHDAALLAELNHRLIADEGHSNPMGVAELEERMRGWLASDYGAVLFHQGEQVVAYALFRDDDSGRIYLRHFYVVPQQRRRGVGRAAFRQLRSQALPAHKSIVLDVLTTNTAARAFWAAVGFREYAVSLELEPLSG